MEGVAGDALLGDIGAVFAAVEAVEPLVGNALSVLMSDVDAEDVWFGIEVAMRVSGKLSSDGASCPGAGLPGKRHAGYRFPAAARRAGFTYHRVRWRALPAYPSPYPRAPAPDARGRQSAPRRVGFAGREVPGTAHARAGRCRREQPQP
jgi:hypothetical protein